MDIKKIIYIFGFLLLFSSVFRGVYATWTTWNAEGIIIPTTSIRLTYTVYVPNVEYGFFVINVTLPTTIQEQLKNLCDTYDRVSVNMYGTYKACRFIYPYRLFIVDRNLWINPMTIYYIEYRDDGIPIRYYFTIRRDNLALGLTNTFYIMFPSPEMYVPTSWYMMYHQGYLPVVRSPANAAFEIVADYIRISGSGTARICYDINKELDHSFPILVGVPADSYNWGSASVVLDLRDNRTGELARIVVFKDLHPSYYLTDIKYAIPTGYSTGIFNVKNIIAEDISRYNVLERVCFYLYGHYSGAFMNVWHFYLNYRTRN